MQTAKNLKAYRAAVDRALKNDFQRRAMDTFAVAYRAGRENAFAGMDVDTMVATVAAAKDDALSRIEQLYHEFKSNAEKKGIRVYLAATAREANEIVADIARSGGVKKIIKSKSMTTEETRLNAHLERLGLDVTETDLGEWIIQLRCEGPSHMVMPAIHLSRHQVADLFTGVTGKTQNAEIERLVKVARRELRQKLVEADMGISGANFALADTATIGLVTNEGNARLVTTLPGIHVALVGIDKLLPSLRQALEILRVLPRNATGQQLTSYVTWITGAHPCAAGAADRKQIHIVFLDNGRRRLARDPVFSQALRCVRCGACANVCPVYRMVGGHEYGHIYIGAIGLILTYFFHGREKAKHLVQNCLNCGACKSVCAAGIDLPRLIKDVHAIVRDESGREIHSVLLGKILKNRRWFHRLLRGARAAQKPLTGGTTYLRHLPMIVSGEHHFRALPAIAEKPFRDMWPAVRPHVDKPRYRVALFSGCVQDFVYPEQVLAAVQLLGRCRVSVELPPDQSCCGLPVEMMGERASAQDVARQNLAAFAATPCDYVVTLCASCASHLKTAYPRLLAEDRARSRAVKTFSEKVVPFSVFMNDIVALSSADFVPAGIRATYHAPCHLCRGLGVTRSPRDLIRKAGYRFVQAAEEETCCGFGGTYSGKFPAISAQILARKLDDLRETEADLLLTECPGCVMQLRGGVMKRGDAIVVKHIAEALAETAR